MKRTALALLLTAVFFIGISVKCLPVVRVAEANPYFPPAFTVLSPKNNTAYGITSLNFTFVVESLDDYDYYYSLDELIKMKQVEVELISERDSETGLQRPLKTLQFSTELHDLSDGQHNLTVHHQYNNWLLSGLRITETDATIIFYIDTAAVKITDLCIEPTGATDRLLGFTIDAETSWVGYSLDNQANVTVNGEAVLKDLSPGSHYVTVYAEDTVGNMAASETLFFTIEEAESESSSVPLVLGTTGVVSAVGVGLFVYYKKYK